MGDKAKGVSAIRGAVSTALWEGLTEEEIKALFTAALLEKVYR